MSSRLVRVAFLTRPRHVIDTAVSRYRLGRVTIASQLRKLHLSDALYLYACVLGQRLDSDGRASGERCLKELSIDLIHIGKISHVSKEDRCLDHMRHVRASLLKDVLDIEQALTRQFFDSAFSEIACSRINGKLTTDKDKIASADSLAVRTYCSRSLGCTNCVHNKSFVNIRVTMQK